MEETNTLLNTEEALKPILELAQESATANISTVRTVVLKALSDPKVFCGFDQVKQVLQGALTGGEGEKLARTLDLFSYGTYLDYSNSPDQYLTLNDTHLFKLRQLTVLTMVQKACSTSQCVVPYKTLAQHLGFTGDAILRQVEEVVLACVYARVLAGQLDQKLAALIISARHGPPCRPRDVPLSEGAAMLAVLRQFQANQVGMALGHTQAMQQTVQMQLDAQRQFAGSIAEKIKKAETTSVGSANNPALICGPRGWPDDVGGERRLSEVGSARGSTTRRQTKRSRGGAGGAMDVFSRY